MVIPWSFWAFLAPILYYFVCKKRITVKIELHSSTKSKALLATDLSVDIFDTFFGADSKYEFRFSPTRQIFAGLPS